MIDTTGQAPQCAPLCVMFQTTEVRCTCILTVVTVFVITVLLNIFYLLLVIVD